jgi:hypothetical protein
VAVLPPLRLHAPALALLVPPHLRGRRRQFPASRALLFRMTVTTMEKMPGRNGGGARGLARLDGRAAPAEHPEHHVRQPLQWRTVLGAHPKVCTPAHPFRWEHS